MRSHHLSLACFALAIGTAAPLPDKRPTSLELGEEALSTGAYEAALGYLHTALTETPDRADHVLFLTALALVRSGQHENALETIHSLRATHPGSPWSARALSLAAEAHLGRRGYAEAAAAMRGALDHLASPERRRAIALAYLDVTAKLEKSEAPDRELIVRLLCNARDLKALTRDEEGSVIERMIAHTLELPSLYVKGIELASELLERGATAPIRLALGRLQAGSGQRWEALQTFLDVAARYPKTDEAAQALHRAAELFGHPEAPPGQGLWNCPDPRTLPLATALLDRLVSEMPDHPLAVSARFERASMRAAFAALQDEAISGLKAFAASYPEHELAPSALIRTGDLLASRSRFEEALELWTQYLQKYTTHAQWPQVQERVSNARYTRATQCAAREEWNEALAAWSAFLDNHPQDERAADAAWQSGEALRRSGDLDGALEQWRRVMSRYPGSAEAGHAQLSIASLFEDRGQFEAALAAFKQVSIDPWKSQAQARVTEITSPALSVEVDRSFPSGAQPSLRIATRNLESFDILVHRVDVRDFFLKTHATEGILRLQVAIAAPDHTETRELPGLEKFRRYEHAITLPFTEPSVYIVTARSGPLEASNAVIVSDVAMLAFLSRRAATVLAIDVKRSEFLDSKSVAVLLAADGRFVEDLAQLPKPARASLLMTAGGSDAFRDFDLADLTVAPDPPPVYSVITDRQFYAPGATVHATALVRESQGSTLVVPDKSFVLEALAPNGLSYTSREAKPNAEGALDLDFALPAPYAEGAWQVTLKENRKEAALLAAAPFTVAPLQESAAWWAHVTTDPARPVWNEEFRIHVTVTDRFGRPARALAIPWALRGDPAHFTGEAVTDASGRVTIEIGATPYLGEELLLSLTLPVEPAIEESVTLEVVNVGRRRTPPDQSVVEALITVDVGRPRLSVRVEGALVGPTDWAREVTVTCDPPDHELHYAVYLSDVAGAMSEVTRGTVSLNEKGEGKVAVTPREPGGYRLEVLGRDRRGIPVTGAASFVAAKPSESQGLFVQPSLTRAAPGEPVDVAVFSVEAMLGWIAVLSDHVIGTEAVHFAKGWNHTRITAPDQRLEKFEVAACGITGRTLHESRAAIDLERHLKVTLETPRPRVAGGEEVPLRVALRDERGHPAKGRVSLVVTDTPEMVLTERPFALPWEAPYIVADASSRTAFASVSREIEGQVLQALAQLEVVDEAGFAIYGLDQAQQANQERRQVADVIGVGGGAGGGFSRRFQGQRRDAGGPPRVLARENLFTAFDVETDSEGKVEFRVRLPFERTTWHVQALAFTKDRTGAASLALPVDETLTVIVPPVVHAGEPSSIVIIGEGRADIEVGGKRSSHQLASGVENVVSFSVPEDASTGSSGRPPDAALDEIPLTVSSGDRCGTFHIAVRSPEEARRPCVFEATSSLEQAGVAAARLLAVADPEQRRRLTRTAEMATTAATGLSDTVALIISLQSARERGEAIDTGRLHSLIEPIAGLLAAREESDARVLRRYLLSFRDDLQSIQLAPFFRERGTLSARALAWLAEMYSRLNRPEEQTAVIAAMDEAAHTGRLFEAIGCFDTEGAARAIVQRIRGDASGLRERVSAAGSPFEAALWIAIERNDELARSARRAPPASAAKAVNRIAHYPDPVVNGRIIQPLTEGIVPHKDYEPPHMAKAHAGDTFRVTATFDLATFDLGGAGWIEEPLPPSCRVVATGDLIYDSNRHALVRRAPKGKFTQEYTLAALTPGKAILEVAPAEAERTPAPPAEPGVLAALARRAYEHKDWEDVLAKTALLLERARVVPPVWTELARQNFRAAVELESCTEAVAFLEILKEIADGAAIDRRDARFAAASYEAAGEPLAALDLYQSLADEHYLEEALLSGELDALGRIEEALSWNERLLVAYPGTPLNRGMLAALAQRRDGAGKKHWDDALRTYRYSLSLFPRASDQDEVTYALANLYVKMAQPAPAERLSAAGVIAYPDSRLHDGFRLLHAIALYAQRDFAKAEAAAREMAADGSLLAKLLAAQILHAEGKLEAALKAYREIVDLFPDARRTVAFLERSGISIPPVTTLRTDEKPALEVEYLGVGEIELKLYAIDLARLYVRSRGRVDLSQIEVAGFRPALEKTVRLARPSGTARLHERVAIEITEPGAYYVTARSGSFGTTGLVLLSDLSMELQADAEGARAYVSDTRANTSAADVRVTFMVRGDAMKIETLRTDLRGIAEVPNLRGALSVIAERKGHVALSLLEKPVTWQQELRAPTLDAIQEELMRNEASIQKREEFYKQNVSQYERSIQVKK
ncbi:MAG: tetratricopeptide repeat protein [Planctomycetota bacterium]